VLRHIVVPLAVRLKPDALCRNAVPGKRVDHAMAVAVIRHAFVFLK
jgi:hypothetical protein